MNDPRVRAALSQRLGYLFAKLHIRSLDESVTALREAGLGLSGVHFGSLSVIEAAGPMSQQMLGECVQKDRTTMVGIVDDLEREGLVERRRNPSDRRAYALEVTEQGHSWLAKAGPILESAERRLLSSLKPGEGEALVELMQRVLYSESPPG